MDEGPISYQPNCSMRGCREPAVYKFGAAWSSGTLRELKNYGVACQAHRDALLGRARARRAELALAEGETVGQVTVYQLVRGKRDVELPRLAEASAR